MTPPARDRDHPAERADVAREVAVEHHHVRQVARREQPRLRLEPERPRGDRRPSRHGLGRRCAHADLEDLDALGERVEGAARRPGVAVHVHERAGLAQLPVGRQPRADACRVSARQQVAQRAMRRHADDDSRRHDPGVVRGVVVLPRRGRGHAVLERAHPRRDGAAHALGGERVRSDPQVESTRLEHELGQLRRRVLRRVRIAARGHHPAGRHHLDEVDALVRERARGGPQLDGGVGRQAHPVAMAERRRDRPARDEHARELPALRGPAPECDAAPAPAIRSRAVW